MYYRKIPLAVLGQVPILAAQVSPEPVDVRVTSFPGDRGETLYGVDVAFNPRAVRRTDRRKNDYVVGERVSIFLNAAGEELEDRQHDRRHRMGEITIGRSESAYVVIDEEELEAELRAAEHAVLAGTFATEVRG